MKKGLFKWPGSDVWILWPPSSKPPSSKPSVKGIKIDEMKWVKDGLKYFRKEIKKNPVDHVKFSLGWFEKRYKELIPTIKKPKRT
jgi:hypothetical protein